MEKIKNKMRLNKIFLLFLIGIFFVSFISAVPPVTTTQQFIEGYEIQIPQDNVIKVGENYEFDFHVTNISNGFQVSSGISCMFHLYDSTGSHKLVMLQSIADTHGDYEFNVSGGNFSRNGVNYYFINCNNSILTGTPLGGRAESILYITPFETEPSVPKAIFTFIALFILFLMLIGGVYGISISEGAWTIGYICLSYISLFCIIFISWNISNIYLFETTIIASILWILWITMAFCFLPFIIGISFYILKKGVIDNLVKEYVKQGYSKEEALDIAKKRRR